MKTVINIILSFLLVFVIIGAISLNLASNTILNKDYAISMLNETEFYLQLSREVKSDFESYIYQSGLPKEIFEELGIDEIIKNDFDSIIDYMYEGTEINISEESLRQSLRNNIDTYLKSEGISFSGSVKTNIERFEDLIIETYEENVNISNTGINMAKEAVNDARNIYEKVKMLPIIALVVILILTIFINIKTLGNVLNVISISALTSGILFRLADWIILKNVEIDNLVILSTSLSNLIIGVARDLLYTISNYGMILIVTGITGIVIGSIIKVIKEKAL